LAAIVIIVSMILCAILSMMPTASAADGPTVTVLQENFENPRWTCDTPWDQDNKEMWVRGDNDPGSGEDTWCFSTHQTTSATGAHTAWCAIVGTNSIAVARGLGTQANTASYRYDANMSAYMRHSLSMSSELGSGELKFIYWSKTMLSTAPGGYDHLSVSVSADGINYDTIWTQPSADEGSWKQATATVPANARTISFDFVSGPYTSGTEWKEGAFIDNILVTQLSDPSWSRVSSLPSHSPSSFDIDVHVDTTQGVPDSVMLYCRPMGTTPYSLYTDRTHPDGRFSSGETIHFDSILAGGELDYQFYSVASGGEITEPQPSVPDASTSVDAVSPQTMASVNRTAGGNGWYNGPVIVRLSATDQRSGVGSIQYELDDGTWSTTSGDVAVQGDGAHVLTYRAVDLAGNVEQERTLSIDIDGTAPSTVYSLDGTGKLTLIPSDQASGVSSTYYRLDGGNWQTYSSPIEALDAGHDALEYYSTDLAGNTEAVITLDLSNVPMSEVTLTLGDIGKKYPTGATVSIAWTCADPSGEVDHYEIAVDGVMVKRLDRNVTSFDLSSLAEGERSVTVRAVDSNGHSVQQTLVLTIGSEPSSDLSGLLIPAIAVAAVGAVVGALILRSRRAG
jgi:hypothetical protein